MNYVKCEKYFNIFLIVLYRLKYIWNIFRVRVCKRSFFISHQYVKKKRENKTICDTYIFFLTIVFSIKSVFILPSVWIRQIRNTIIYWKQISCQCMALYHCRVQTSKHATGTRLPVHWTLKCYAKNLCKESLRPLVDTHAEISARIRSVHRDYLVYHL